MPRDYALHLNAIAAAEHAAAEARKTVEAHRHRLREAARQEARESCEAAGIVLGRTILTIQHRRRQQGHDYRDWPIIPMRITCWSAPGTHGQVWQFQMHHARARRDGQRDQRIQEDWHNLLVNDRRGRLRFYLCFVPPEGLS
jgi:hypothetical protein